MATTKSTNASKSISTPSTSTSTSAPLPRVLFAVTGFGPFAGVTENPTQRVVEALRQKAESERKEEEEEKKERKKKENDKAKKNPTSSLSSSHSSPPSVFSLARSLVKTDVLRVSAADVERWVRVDLEDAVRRVAEEAAEKEEKAGEEEEEEEEEEEAGATAAAARNSDAAGPPCSSSTSSFSPLRRHFVAVHLGVYASATSPTVRLETRAHNSADFRVPDADGRVLLREPITKEEKTGSRALKFLSKNDERASASALARELKLESGLPLERVARRLSDPRWTVATTGDAGRYLCNFIYWHSLRACCCSRDDEEKKKGSISALRRLLLLEKRKKPEEEKAEKPKAEIVRHAVFVHLPPAELLPVESQLGFVERLLKVVAEEVLVGVGGGGGGEEEKQDK